MSDEVTNDVTAQTEQSVQSTDSAPADMPSSAPEAPASEVIPPPVKDDNSIPAQPESQPTEPAQAEPTAQTGETPPAQEQKPEPISPTPDTPKNLETPPETGTAQIPPNEPLGSVDEPKVSEPEPIFSAPARTPAPISAEPISQPQPKSLARQLIAKAREAIQNRKRKKIDHVMDLFAKRTNITNNQVADFLHVSDATATRYLQILENENRIKQVGKTGKGVRYEKI